MQGALDWIALKAMEKDLTCRYETANGLALDVQRHAFCRPCQDFLLPNQVSLAFPV